MIEMTRGAYSPSPCKTMIGFLPLCVPGSAAETAEDEAQETCSWLIQARMVVISKIRVALHFVCLEAD